MSRCCVKLAALLTNALFIYGLNAVINTLSAVINTLSSVIYTQSTVINTQSSVINTQSTVINALSAVINAHRAFSLLVVCSVLPQYQCHRSCQRCRGDPGWFAQVVWPHVQPALGKEEDGRRMSQ